MIRRIVIRWTETARQQLSKLPPKVRKGLIAKADALQHCEDPRKAHKPLVGPLEGYYRLTYTRYRAIYSVEDDKSAPGSIRIEVRFIACGKRKERDKNDIYRLAEKMVNFGLISLEDEDEPAGE